MKGGGGRIYSGGIGRVGRCAGAEIEVNLADGFGEIVIEIGIAGGEEVLGAGEAGDGGGGQAENAEDVGKLVEIGIGEGGFDEATGEEADEGNLFDEAGDIGGFDAGEVTFFEATGVEAMLEGVLVAGWGTGATG